ncbi:hypothetical protein E2I00_009177, partial [Balaenoptera physalus]
NWLRLYGYLPQPSRHMSTMRSAQILASALAEMQRFYGIPITGVLDEETKAWMKRPRCGVPDQFGVRVKANLRRRRKRYALTGRKWNNHHLTFSNLGLASPAHMGSCTGANWGLQEVPYEDIRLRRQKEADIMVLFASGFHGDSSPFDGTGGFLAHAYFPGPGLGGDTHFDADEPWTFSSTDLHAGQGDNRGGELEPQGSEERASPVQSLGAVTLGLSLLPIISKGGVKHGQALWPPQPTPALSGVSRTWARSELTVLPAPTTGNSLFLVAVHELGHALGLEHSSNPSAIMAPFYQWMDIDNFQLPEDDLRGIQQLYGERAARGRWFWRVRHNRVLDNYPMPIGHFWRGLPSDISAAYERQDGRFVFFKGELGQPSGGSPRVTPSSSKRTGLTRKDPRPVRTGLQAPAGPQPCAFGHRYWRFNEDTQRGDPGYPKPISVWQGIPASPKGAFLSNDAAYTYFYKGTKYWKFDNERLRMEPGYPKSILRDFMGCQEHVEPGPRWPDGTDEDGGSRVVVQMEEVTRTVNMVMVLVPPMLLLLCILGLTYALVQMQRKGAPRMLLYCKRSLQEWV